MTDLRKLAEAATPGPWSYDDSGDLYSTDEDGALGHLGHVPYDEDGEFIAACSPEAIIALLDRAERAERERDEARAALELRPDVDDMPRPDHVELVAAAVAHSRAFDCLTDDERTDLADRLESMAAWIGTLRTHAAKAKVTP